MSFIIAAIFINSHADSTLPWKNITNLPWQIANSEPIETPKCPTSTQSYQPLTVYILPNGAVKIIDRDGLVRLRVGLPGRPRKIWRDYGNRVANVCAPISFPIHSQLQRNVGNVLADTLDFCSTLEGLLWILCDDDSVITIISPATSRMVYLPLPPGQDFTILFHPNYIEILEENSNYNKKQTSWSLYWLTLIPHLIKLGGDDSHQLKRTALLPFGK